MESFKFEPFQLDIVSDQQTYWSIFDNDFYAGSSPDSATPPSLESVYLPTMDHAVSNFSDTSKSYTHFEGHSSSYQEDNHPQAHQAQPDYKGWNSHGLLTSREAYSMEPLFHPEYAIDPTLPGQYPQNIRELQTPEPSIQTRGFSQFSIHTLQTSSAPLDRSLLSEGSSKRHFTPHIQLLKPIAISHLHKRQRSACTSIPTVLRLECNFSNTSTEERSVPEITEPTAVQRRISAFSTASGSMSSLEGREEEQTPLQKSIIVFNMESGSTRTHKQRKKLNTKDRKDFKIARETGACHQCRVLKRKCLPASPCSHCIKHCARLSLDPSVANTICQRESPFKSPPNTNYYLYSSSTRIVDFDVQNPWSRNEFSVDASISVNDHSQCECKFPIQVSFRDISALGAAERNAVLKIRRSVEGAGAKREDFAFVVGDDETLSRQLEQWSLNYASEYCEKYDTNLSAIHSYAFGASYLAASLPGSDLIASSQLVVALSYIIRTGLLYHPPHTSPSSTYPTITAKLSTLLYRSLCTVEERLQKQLESLIWTSYGVIDAEMKYAVGFVLWQTLRLTCLRLSHLTNIVSLASNKESLMYEVLLREGQEKEEQRKAEVERMEGNYRMLLSMNMALYKSKTKCPLLLDFGREANWAVLGWNEEVIRQAVKLGDTVRRFRRQGFAEGFRGSVGYNEGVIGRLKELFD